MKLIYPSILILVLLTLATASDAQNSMRVLEAQFAEIDSAISRLKNKKSILNDQLQDKASEIQELKNKSELSYFQRQKLEELLKDSQDLSSRMVNFDSEIREMNHGLVKTGNALLTNYDSEIKKSLKNLETKDLSQEYRKTILQNIETLRRKKEKIKNRTGQERAIEIRVSQLQIEPDDTPTRIKQKADLLKDQEDKFRRLANQINNQKEELTNELNLKNRLDDLMTDLALFDQQEEILGNLSAAEDGNRVAVDEAANSDAFSQGLRSSENNLIVVGQKDFDFSNLSTEQLEDIIEGLLKQKKEAEVKADSLGKQAEVFYKAAKQSERR